MNFDTLKRPDWVSMSEIPRPKRERRLPVVLSREEIQWLFAVVTNLKQKNLFMVAYDAGLRISEILNLRLDDLNSRRMVIRGDGTAIKLLSWQWSIGISQRRGE